MFYVVAQYKPGDYLQVGLITTDRNKAEEFVKDYAVMQSLRCREEGQSWVINEVEDGDEFPDLG